MPALISRIKNALTKIHPFVFIAFLICFVVWGYLLYVTESIIIWDSEGYENLGRLIHEKGWVSYFKTGPHREAGYSFLISISMGIADLTGKNFLEIQRCIQVLFLFLTLLFAYYILTRLKIHPFLSALGILYMGLSPGLLNSSLILYSEAATYPFVLLSIITYAHLYESLDKSTSSTVLFSFLLSLAFFYLTTIKGIFEPLSYLFFFPLLYQFYCACRKRKQKLLKNTAVSLGIILLCFYVPVTAFKLANKIHNGEYTLSDRGGMVLYTSTIPRIKPLGTTDLLALIAHIPGNNTCLQYFEEARCNRWEWWFTNTQMSAELKSYTETHGGQPLNQKQIARLAIKKALEHPFRYSLTTFIQGFSIFIWEYFYGFVAYPNWVDGIFLNPAVAASISYTSSLLALFSFCYVCGWIFKKRSAIMSLHDLEFGECLLFALFSLLLPFMLLSSLFFIINRYVLVIAPLYIIIITFTIGRACKKMYLVNSSSKSCVILKR